MIKSYCVNFTGYILVNAETSDEAWDLAAEELHGLNIEVTEVEQMEEDVDYYADRY